MNNLLSAAFIIVATIIFVIYKFDIGGVATEREQKMVYFCQEVKKGVPTNYFSKRKIEGDNCTPPSPLMIKQDLFPGIRD